MPYLDKDTILEMTENCNRASMHGHLCIALAKLCITWKFTFMNIYWSVLNLEENLVLIDAGASLNVSSILVNSLLYS